MHLTLASQDYIAGAGVGYLVLEVREAHFQNQAPHPGPRPYVLPLSEPKTPRTDTVKWWLEIGAIFGLSCLMLVREADMGLFKKKNPQDAFDPDVFTITDTILDPPRFTFLPAIYQDATRRKWAVHQRGAQPKIFDYADVLQCEVAEAGDPEAEEAVSKQEFAQRILANPAKAAKINAAKRNMCLGMGVVVAVQTGKDEVSKLEIPVMTDEVKRDSSLYKSYRNVAEKIKAEFDAMGGLA